MKKIKAIFNAIHNSYYDAKYWLSEEIRYKGTDLGFWLIKRVNPGRSRGLSQLLFELAEWYNTKPGTNNYYIPKKDDKNS